MKKILLVTVSLLLAGNALQAKTEEVKKNQSKKEMVGERVKRTLQASLYWQCYYDNDSYYGYYYHRRSRHSATGTAEVKKICRRPYGELGKRN